MTLVARPTELRQETRIDEKERTLELFRQAEQTGAQLVRAPDGMDRFEVMLQLPDTRATAAEAFRQEWEKTLHRLVGQPGTDADTELHVFRLATTLAAHHQKIGEDQRARALLETALDHLSDVDLRGIVRCLLSRAAALIGDVEAARAWLEGVNPRPLKLEADLQYRLAVATTSFVEKNSKAVLDTLSWSETDPLVALSPTALYLMANALADIGQVKQAKKALHEFGRRYEQEDLSELIEQLPGAASSFALQTATRASSVKAVRSILTFLLVVVGPIVLAAIAFRMGWL
ncbi:MAG: hypothetical protein DRI90_06910 [Deltaproteobacteria bacterium]|nr:MAG: hypothetical protein DRI90_06910 [Deltaproteobacteria bacterium]